jgi:hypothetical protein
MPDERLRCSEDTLLNVRAASGLLRTLLEGVVQNWVPSLALLAKPAKIAPKSNLVMGKAIRALGSRRSFILSKEIRGSPRRRAIDSSIPNENPLPKKTSNDSSEDLPSV